MGDNIALEESHIEEVQVVEQFFLEADSKKNHQNCIKSIYNYWGWSFPDYFRVDVRDLTENKLNNNTNVYLKNTKDIVYKSLNIKFLKAFVAMITKKPSGKTSSYKHI